MCGRAALGMGSKEGTRDGSRARIGIIHAVTGDDAMGQTRAAGERALVLGGAGSTGHAWEIGVIAGLFDAGLDVTEADLTIGTSAGSTAAAQITSGTPPTELLANIRSAAPRTAPAEPG